MTKYFILLFLFYSSQTMAFKFTPMVSEIDISKSENKIKFNVVNGSDQTIAVQIRAMNRVMDKNGKENRTDAKKDFLIFPNQLFLKVNERRSILIKYKGDVNIDQEKSYRIIAEQVDVNAKENLKDKAGANLKILLRYVASLYITKSEFSGEVVFKEPKIQSNNISVEAINKGKKHVTLKDLKVRVIKNNQTLYTYKDKELEGFAREIVQANNSRIFNFPLVKEIPKDGSARFEITY